MSTSMPASRVNRVIRCFVSSTFVDMTIERDLLQKEIVPEIKAYCKDKGWQFEVIDLRWGISAEAAAHHRTMHICLSELDRCMKISPRPNMILLLGQRYGWIPIPEFLPSFDFNRVTAVSTKYEKRIFERWYELAADGNYELRPASDKLAEEIYAADEPVLRRVFDRVGVESNTDFRDSYCSSATEQEIIKGLFRFPDIKDHVLCYTRQLTDVPNTCADQFIETEFLERVENLKAKVRRFLDVESISDITLPYEQYIRDDFKTYFVDSIKTKLYEIVNKEIRENRKLTDEYIEDLYQAQILANSNLESTLGPNNLYLSIGVSAQSSCGTNIIKSLLRRIGEKYRDSDADTDLLWRLLLRLMPSNETEFNDIYLIGSERIKESDLLRQINWDSLPSLTSHKLYLIDSHNNISDISTKDIDFDYLCRPENLGKEVSLLILSLLVFSCNGVNEDEIMEILSLDNDFCRSLESHSYHKILPNALGAKRIPYTIWSRFYSFIEASITCRQTATGVTYSFTSEDLKQKAKHYIREREPSYESRVIRLMIQYYSNDVTFRKTRVVEALPYLYYITDQHKEFCNLVCNNEYLQVAAEHALIDNVLFYIEQIIASDEIDNHIIERLRSRYGFLVAEKSGILKYAKLNRTIVANHEANFKNYCEKYDIIYCYLNDIRIAKVFEDGKAIIVANSKGDSSGLLTMALYVDMISHERLGITYIPIYVTINATKTSYYKDDIVSANKHTDGRIIIYTDYGKVIFWDPQTGNLLIQKNDELNFEVDTLTPLWQSVLGKKGLNSEDKINGLVYQLCADGSLEIYDKKTGFIHSRIKDRFTEKAYMVTAVPANRSVVVTSEHAIVMLKFKD